MFDTRRKIMNLDQARQWAAAQRSCGRRVRALVAYCDPLLPAHVERLRRLAGDEGFLVFLHRASDPILDARACAELAAALSFVQGVVTANGDDAVRLAQSFGADELLLEQEAEAALRDEFLRRVRERAAQA